MGFMRMRMKYVAWLNLLLTVAFVVAVSSCGGGTGEGGGGGNVTLFLVRVELPGRDPLNIESGTGSLKFELAGYVQGTGERVKLNPTSWMLEDVQGDVGTIQANDGTFTPGTQGSAYVNVVWNGNPTPIRLQIVVRPSGLARLAGTVIGSGGTTAGTVVAFFDDSNNEVGRATVMSNGQFLGLVPTTARKINVPEKPSSYYPGEWTYNGDTYSWNIQNCHAIMVLNQALQPGQTSTLVGSIGLFARNNNSPPPPPPTGCRN